MANVFIGVARGGTMDNLGAGADGVIVGTSSTATLDVELRVAQTDQQGAAMNKKDAEKAIRAIRAVLFNQTRVPQIV